MVYLTIAAMLALVLSPALLPASISLGHAVLRWRAARAESAAAAPAAAPAGHRATGYRAVPATA